MSLPAQLFSLKGRKSKLRAYPVCYAVRQIFDICHPFSLSSRNRSQEERSAQPKMWEYRMVPKRESCHFRSMKLLTSLRSCVRLLVSRAHVCRSFNKLDRGAPFSPSSGFRWHLKQKGRILSAGQWTSATNFARYGVSSAPISYTTQCRWQTTVQLVYVLCFSILGAREKRQRLTCE